MELTPVMNEKSKRAVRFRGFAILQCLLRATGSCFMTEICILIYAPIYIKYNFLEM